MTKRIPIIDLEAWYDGNPRQRRQLCARLRRVCHETGFFYIVNQGIPAETTGSYLEMLRAFFALPVDTKRAISKSNSPQFRGWEALGSEVTNNETDFREQIDIGVESEAISDPDPYYMALVGPNQWPPVGIAGISRVR